MTNILTHTRRPDITFCRDGRILISARLARTLGIMEGSSINVAFEDQECYVFARHHRPGESHIARCWPSKHKGGTYCASSVLLSRAMLDHCGITGDKAAFSTGAVVTRADQTFVTVLYKIPLL